MRLGDNPRVVVARHAPIAGKVGVVTGGGSGHEPAFLGYTGRNMLDAVAVGELFSSPTAKSFHDAIRAADGGKGVIVLYGNYAGDNMNVEMAAKGGIEIAIVVTNDDVCSTPPEEREKRRGVVGEIFMWKVGAAKAADGRNTMQTFSNTSSGIIVLSMAERIVENRAYLSEIDGRIGDGDRGVNMAKGFGMAAERLKDSLSGAFETLGTVLMTEIGGSMGPLYGVMFTAFAETIEGGEAIDPGAFSRMLHAGLAGIRSIGSFGRGRRQDAARHIRAGGCGVRRSNLGGKTLRYSAGSPRRGSRSRARLDDRPRRQDRASRLGERSRGVLDAGATSCAIILTALSRGAASRLTP